MKEKIALIIILLLGLTLRTASLNVSPPGFNADEAALGYNAYSILKTGKDEWGELFPIVFKSFSDYKPGLYIYLTIPFVALLGLSEWAVRLPSILLGTISILVTYLLSKELFKSSKVVSASLIGLSSAFLLSISPWHIHFSRGAWETNIATFFMLLGVWSFVKGLSNFRYFYLTSISLALSMYAYQSTRLVVPLLFVFYAIFYFRQILSKNIVLPILIGLIILFPLIFISFSNKGLARFRGVSIFTDRGPYAATNQIRGLYDNPNGFNAKFFNNKFSAYGISFLQHYLDHFTPKFLFSDGDPLGRNKIPEMGQMYFFEIATLLAGIYFLLKNHFNKIVFTWVLVAPIAASLTYQTPHALRAHNMVIPLTIISGVGLGFLISKIGCFRPLFKSIVLTSGLVVLLFFISRFLHQYFVHLPKEYALEWEYGFSQVVPYVFANGDQYQKIYVTDRYDQPYILFLFYSKYDPLKYQISARPTPVDKYGFSTVTSFDKFEFKRINIEDIQRSQKSLFVVTEEELKNTIKSDKVINFPNGKPAFEIVGVK